MCEKGDLCEVFKTNRGGIKLYVNGFSFARNRIFKNVFYWVCEMRRNDVYNCRASICTTIQNDGMHIVKRTTNNHNHEPDPMRKKIADFKEKIKAAAVSGVRACNILQDSSITDVLESLPSTTALKQMIYRRKKVADITEEPKDIHFELKESDMQIDGDNFILKDWMFDENKRILIMSTLSLMTVLSNSQYWILDEIPKKAPSIFRHLYTIHGNVYDNKKTFPLLFCLCTHKDERTYDVMFELIMEYGSENNINMAPSMCILDFEQAAILSMRTYFGKVILQGCNFHLGQTIYRKVQDHNCLKKYGTDTNFNQDIKCLLALSYVDELEIPTYFYKLLDHLQDSDSKTIACWFEENYIGSSSDKIPLYPPNFWSWHKPNSMNITQNAAKTWHHKIDKIMDKQGVYYLIKVLIQETISNIAEISIIMSGAPTETKKRKSDKEDRFEKILENKNDYSEIQFLKAIATHLYI